MITCRNKIGSKLYRFPEMMNGFFHLSFLKQSVPKIIMCFGVARFERSFNGTEKAWSDLVAPIKVMILKTTESKNKGIFSSTSRKTSDLLAVFFAKVSLPPLSCSNFNRLKGQ